MVDLWRASNLVTMLFLVLCLSLSFRIWLPLWAAWVYFLVRGLLIFENPFYIAPMFRVQATGAMLDVATPLDQTAGQAFAQLLIYPLGVFLLPPRLFKYWRKLFFCLGILESFLLLTQGEGLFSASSFDAAFIAVLIPILNWWAWGPCAFAVAASPRAGTAFVVVLSMLLSVPVRRGWVEAGLAFCGALMTAAFAMAVLPSLHGFGSAGRVDAWFRFMYWWRDHASWLFGTGTGTFQWIGPAIDGLEGKLFLQMHNDWLQVLFEGGVIGFALVFMAYVYLLVKANGRPKLFASLIGYGAFALTYHPLRFPLSALLLCCLVRETLIEQTHKSQ